METGPEKTTTKRQRKFVKNGAIWLKRKAKDGAGNRTQYMMIQMTINDKVMLFSAWPNPRRFREDQPHFIVYSSQPVGEGEQRGRKRKPKSE